MTTPMPTIQRFSTPPSWLPKRKVSSHATAIQPPMRPHLPVSPCQPQSSGRSCSTGWRPRPTWPSPARAGRRRPRPGVLLAERRARRSRRHPAGSDPDPRAARRDARTGRRDRGRRGGGCDPCEQPREVTVLGSTGSIGTQAIAVARQNPDRLRVTGLAAGGGTSPCWPSRRSRSASTPSPSPGRAPRRTSSSPSTPPRTRAARRRASTRCRRSWPGPSAAEELAARPADVVLNGITGSIGLGPTLAALEAGRTLALANKESLIAGGALVRGRRRRRARSCPVDSEHSALAQCLRGGARREVAPAGPDRRAAARSAAAPATSWPTSPSTTPWPTRPGTWARSSRSTPPRWSTRAWR